MEATPRMILAILMTSVMVLIVTLIATWLDLGLGAGFVGKWLKAYFVAWPVAAVTAFVVMPPARRLTLLARIREISLGLPEGLELPARSVVDLCFRT